jgi:hypothetical protein
MATTTGNVRSLLGVARGRRMQARVCPGQLRTRSSAISSRSLAWRLVFGHVEFAAAVEPLLLAKDVGGHRLPPAGL